MVIKINAEEEKEKIAEDILRDLPEWFGLPDSTKEYIQKSKKMPFWAEI